MKYIYNLVMPSGTEIYLQKSYSWYNTTAIIAESYHCNDTKTKDVYHTTNIEQGDTLWDLTKKLWNEEFDRQVTTDKEIKINQKNI